MSRPTWARGLKLITIVLIIYTLIVAIYEGEWLKIGLLQWGYDIVSAVTSWMRRLKYRVVQIRVCHKNMKESFALSLQIYNFASETYEDINRLSLSRYAKLIDNYRWTSISHTEKQS